ncbi:hypothetical protein BN1221_02289 [Brenneria goodwinii]|uniref:DUF2684 domain-containing protein n=1 Tax=Brenneria goodwinii TaxID=1109412 RepID=A0A0G4JVE3_9GAMM|nr:hypothetical protein BN1221_02289 [Brenneria goodwinii]
MSFFTFKSKPLSSLPVNQYRWINIWTSILGHILDSLPAVFGFNCPSFFIMSYFLLLWATTIFSFCFYRVMSV